MARTAKDPRLEPGRIYRTHELARWTTNLSRLTRRLVREKKLVRLAYGFYLCPDDRSYARQFLGLPPAGEKDTGVRPRLRAPAKRPRRGQARAFR